MINVGGHLQERKLERKSSDLTAFENTEGKEMAVLPTLLDDAVDEEAPLLVPSASFNERSLEEPLVIRSTYVRKLTRSTLTAYNFVCTCKCSDLTTLFLRNNIFT